MPSSLREIGTLIVVVLRAKNLPNKRRIGKQDPYCSMRFNTETRRTKAVKRGGQHPEWDEEFRFQIYEDAEDELARVAGGDKTPPRERFRNIKGGKTMRLSCYADSSLDPDLIGEAQVDLTDALTKGEVDEWFTLQSKDKYAGEVYLEMTCWWKEKHKPPAPSVAALDSPKPSTPAPAPLSPTSPPTPSFDDEEGEESWIRATKPKKSRFSFIDRLFNTQKRPEISVPYDPIYLTHVGFNSMTGEFTGLPKEWQQLLSDSGVSRLEQERNPEAVIEVLRFYQETQSVSADNVQDKIHSSPSQQGVPPPERWPEVPNKPSNGSQNPRLPQNPLAKQRSPEEQPPRLPAFDFGPSTSRPAPPSPLLAATSLSFDQSKSQRVPPAPSSQPEVGRSRSQRDLPRLPSPSLSPQKSTAVEQNVVQDHRIREHDDQTVVPARRLDDKGGRDFSPSSLAGTALPAEPFDRGKDTPSLPHDYPPSGTTPDAMSQSPQGRVPHAEITSLMTISEVISHLGGRGCVNLNDQLDETSCTKYPISNGGYGDIYRARLKSGTEVAIKTMRLLLDAQGQKHIKHAARELYTWSKCRHRNVQQLLGLIEFRDQIGMVSVWEANGDLSNYIQRHPETDRYQMSTQIAEGLAYLHQSGIIHGDLKGSNILVSGSGIPLLADFGNATLHEYTLNFTGTTTKSAISSRWAAPELFKGTTTHNAPTDVYALGMTILETITGSLPWAGKVELAVIFAVVSKEYPERPVEHIPTHSKRGNMLWALLRRCWVYEPEDRPRVAEVKDLMQGITYDVTV